MYKFIFNFFYRYHKEGKGFNPRFTATLAVASTVFFQLFLIINIITYITGVNLFGKPFSQDYSTNKLYMLPFGIVYLFPFILFYTHKRAMAIVKKYPEDYKVINLKNIFLVLLIMIAPLLIGIYFINSRY